MMIHLDLKKKLNSTAKKKILFHQPAFLHTISAGRRTTSQLLTYLATQVVINWLFSLSSFLPLVNSLFMANME